MKNKYNLTRTLAFRIFFPMVMTVLLAGGCLFYLLSLTLSDFILHINKSEMKSYSSALYNIGDQSLNSLMHRGQSGNKVAIRIAQAKAKSEMGDYLRKEELLGLIEQNGKEIYRSEKLPDEIRHHIFEGHDENYIIDYYLNGKKYYLYNVHFDPWLWDIIIVRDAAAYTSFVNRFYIIYTVITFLLCIGNALLYLYFRRSVNLPVKNIINSLIKKEVPQYQGVYEFEFLSNHIGEMVRSLQDQSHQLQDEMGKLRDAEESIKASEEKFSKSFHSSPLLMAISTIEEGEFIEINDLFVQVTGYEREQLIGTTSTELGLFTVEQRNSIRRELLKKGRLNGLKVKLRGSDGEDIYALLYGEILTIGGKKRLLSITQDITESRNAEKERERLLIKLGQAHKMESIGTLATGIAHEINQPLSFIKIVFESTQRDIQNSECSFSELEEDCKESLKQITRITAIIDHLRAFGREDASMMGDVDLGNILNSALILLGQRMKLRDIEFMSEIEENLPKIIANNIKVEQVFINLFQNSIDALEGMKEGKITVSIYTENDSVKIRFADNGRGIPEILQNKIFEPFFTTKEVGKGTGLGLSIIYGIIQEIKGEIVYLGGEQGSNFLITIPIKKNEKEN